MKAAAAHRAVGRAIEAGDLTRPDKCSQCATLGPVEGHHDDYSTPLEVRWLCARCHRHFHATYGRVTTGRTETATHELLLLLAKPLHRQLRDRAAAEHRSIVGHIRYLIEEDCKVVDLQTKRDAA